MRRLLILLSFLFLSCSAVHADQTLSLAPFHQIKSDGVFDMEITVGGVQSTQSVTFQGKDERLNKLSVRVADGELLISGSQLTGGMGLSREGKFVITVPSLSLFHGKGVGKVEIFQIQSDKIDISFEGAGKLRATGKVKSLQLKGLGVGEIDTQKLLAENADVDLEGVGDVKIYVSNQLNVLTRGVGALTYYGKPRVINNSSSGIGRVGAGD